MMTRFIIMTVMVPVKITVQFCYEFFIATHKLNHTGNILHYTKKVSPPGTFCNTGTLVVRNKPIAIIGAGLHKTFIFVVDILIVF